MNHRLYEIAKKQIEAQNLPAEEYKKAIRKLAERLNV